MVYLLLDLRNISKLQVGESNDVIHEPIFEQDNQIKL